MFLVDTELFPFFLVPYWLPKLNLQVKFVQALSFPHHRQLRDFSLCHLQKKKKSQGVFLALGSGYLKEGWRIVLGLAIEPVAKKPCMLSSVFFKLFSLKWKYDFSFW